MNKANFWKWVERRFWDFRFGHGTYLAYALALINFIVINYSLLVSNIDFLSGLFTNLWMFALVFIMTYFPTATIIGWFIYRKRQFHTDMEISTLENPYRFKAVLPSKETLLNLPLLKLNLQMLMKFYKKEGLLTPEVKKQYEDYLQLIGRLMEGESIEEAKENS